MRKNSSPNSKLVDLSRHLSLLQQVDPLPVAGRVRRADGLIIESDGPPVSVGEVCDICSHRHQAPVEVEVVGFRDKTVLSMPIYETEGIRLGDRIFSRRRVPSIPVGPGLLGRVIDGNGQPLDGKGPLGAEQFYPLRNGSQNPLERREIDTSLGTGVRCIDSMLTLGGGQRVGIFGGSGVGKSTLLGMMARYTEAPISVIALVGERAREVNSFIQDDLGEDGLAKSIVVVSTSDNPPLMRIRAALVATTVAEYFRDMGRDVLLVMDSVTRVAMAQREVGLAAGEPPSSKGYTPSVFSLLPKMFERVGRFQKGSITGIYTVLVEGDDMNEPVADAVRGLLDGHIVLSRELAWRNHFPAISVLESISRLMPRLVGREHLDVASRVRELMSAYRKAEDLIDIGAYSEGSNATIDQAIEVHDAINAFLQQRFDEGVSSQETEEQLHRLLEKK